MSRSERRAASLPAAALDVGTNTVLLLVGRHDRDGELEILLDRCATPRLGQGLAASGALSALAVERTLAVLREYQRDLTRFDVPAARVRAVGTAVFRRARDGPDLARRVRAELGLELEIASEDEEARLAHAAVVQAGGAAETLVIDVGGGSSELIWDGGRRRASIPLGAVVLTETYLADPPLRSGGFEALCAHVRQAAAALPEGLARERGLETVALGGSALNLAALVADLTHFDHLRAEGVRTSAEQAERWALALARMPIRERLRLPIEPERAEILPAGLACLGGVLRRIGAAEVRLSGRGLRYGLLCEALSGSNPAPAGGTHPPSPHPLEPG